MSSFEHMPSILINFVKHYFTENFQYNQKQKLMDLHDRLKNAFFNVNFGNTK